MSKFAMLVASLAITATLAVMSVSTASASSAKVPPRVAAVSNLRTPQGVDCASVGFPVPPPWRHLLCETIPQPGLPTNPPQGGNGCQSNCNGDIGTPISFIVNHDSRTLYCADRAVKRVGEPDGDAVNLIDNQIDLATGTFEGAKLSNAKYVQGVGATCDPTPGLFDTLERVDGSGNLQADGPYRWYAAK